MFNRNKSEFFRIKLHHTHLILNEPFFYGKKLNYTLLRQTTEAMLISFAWTVGT